MSFKRWSQATPSDMLCHPDAVAQAIAMEAQGYVQIEDPTSLQDQEDVALLDGASGGAALARYHRQGEEVDANGIRSQHVFEAWPGSGNSDMMPYEKTLRRTQEGKDAPRLAIFRSSKAAHYDHALPLYAARDRLGR